MGRRCERCANVSGTRSCHEEIDVHPGASSADTKINGTLHYPSHAARVQLGIWDASNPAGTSEWAKGPIDWDSAPHKMSATFRSVSVECPY